MPNHKGGKKHRRAKKGGGGNFTRELVLKSEGQEYARVEQMLGNGRLRAQCYDGKNRLCTIRGNMRKKVWVCTGDLILIGIREFQDDKADVMHKYSADEDRKLKAMGEFEDSNTSNGLASDSEDDCAFDFDDL